MDKAFKDIFEGGAEHRRMMHSEASAAILQVASRCAETLMMLGKYSSYPWSIPILKNAASIKRVLLDEYSLALSSWRRERSIEKLVSMKNAIYHRITLAETPGFQNAIDEEATMMEHIDKYAEISRVPKQYTRAGGVALHCEALVLQVARFMCTLVGIIDKKAAKKVRAHVEEPVFNSRRVFLGIATDRQKFEILHKLQEEKGLGSDEVLRLSHKTIFVMSHGAETEEYHGFIIVDTPFYMPAADKKTVEITHVEIASSYMETSLGREVTQWIKSTARGNGFKLLCSKTLKPSRDFWIECDFDVRERSGIAIFDLDPMIIENIINRT
jgi:hypothetical protein